MARVSSAPEGGKFRARAAAALDGVAALWGGPAGSETLLCVEVDGNGELILATPTNCDGVIDVTEGKTDRALRNLGDTDFRSAVGGKRYTVIHNGDIQEMADGTLAAGDRIYADAAGDIRVGIAGGAGDVFVGIILEDETVRGGDGLVLHVNVNGAPVGTA